MFNLIPLAFAGLMAFIDTIVLSLFKGYSSGLIKWRAVVPIGMVLYSLHPYIFLQALNYESMTVMNLLFDVLSDISVTIMGLFYFKESLSNIKRVGLVFAFIGIILLSYDSINGKS
jgi:multidrug transporter EmrE-like cation transporter